jgi:hypothetical protein
LPDVQDLDITPKMAGALKVFLKDPSQLHESGRHACGCAGQVAFQCAASHGYPVVARLAQADGGEGRCGRARRRLLADKLGSLDDPVRDEPQAGQAEAAEDPTGG